MYVEVPWAGMYLKRRNSVNNQQECLMLCSERTIKLNKYQNISWSHNEILRAAHLTGLFCRIIPFSEFFIGSYTQLQLRESPWFFFNKRVEGLKIQIFLCFIYREAWWQNCKHLTLTFLFTGPQSACFLNCEAYYGIKHEDIELRTIRLYCLQFHQQNLT